MINSVGYDIVENDKDSVLVLNSVLKSMQKIVSYQILAPIILVLWVIKLAWNN